MPSSASSIIVSSTSLIISGSSADVGSSNSMIRGLHAQGSGNRHTLLLTTRQLTGILVRLIRDFHLLKEVHRQFFGFFLGRFTHPDRGQVQFSKIDRCGKRLKCWKHIPTSERILSMFLMSETTRAIDFNATLLVLFQRVDAANERGFTRPRRSTNHDPLAAVYCQINVAQHVECAVPLVHVFELKWRLSSDTLVLLQPCYRDPFLSVTGCELALQPL